MNIIRNLLNLLACPDTCKACKSAETPLNGKGVCTAFCSKYGFCGESDGYKADGQDCRGCAGKHNFNNFSFFPIHLTMNSTISPIYL